ncbi:amidohydrolase family protein [Yinghuangia sp. YIM S09857]|uniref:amidohydrolase family protein n=1 Tax=Yinghuangia sp. YIM S09857 TaxID=3436929 RepID=UPI003F53432B
MEPPSLPDAPEPVAGPDRAEEGTGEGAGRRAFLRRVSAGGAGLALTGALPLVSAGNAQAADPSGNADASRATTDGPIAADATTAIVIMGGTLIDGTGGPARPNQVIVIVGDRIVWVGGDTARAPIPSGARIVDARGKYVIPGLSDMHTHWTVMEKIVPPLFIANGVTSVREMWGYPEVRDVRRRIDSGELLGPRMVMASTILDGTVSLLGPPSVRVGTPEEARAAVRQAKADGCDFIKIYSYLSPECLHAIADEARLQKLQFAGHHAYRLSVGEVSDAGMRSFEHLHGIPVPLSSDEEGFRRRIAATPMDPADPRAFFRVMRELERQAAGLYSPAKAARVYARWVRNGTWQSPTLTVNRVMSSPADTYARDPRLKYIPPDLRAFWADAVRVYAPATPEEIAQQREFLDRRLAMVREMYLAGVGVIAGTDVGNPYCFPGFGIHDELELLVEAGLTPHQALGTATRDAARFMGLDVGTVVPGKAADLVVLEADPLRDIRNTRRVDSVVTRGRLITSAHRQRLLDDAEAAAQEPSTAAGLGGAGGTGAGTGAGGAAGARVSVRSAMPACGCFPLPATI